MASVTTYDWEQEDDEKNFFQCTFKGKQNSK